MSTFSKDIRKLKLELAELYLARERFLATSKFTPEKRKKYLKFWDTRIKECQAKIASLEYWDN